MERLCNVWQRSLACATMRTTGLGLSLQACSAVHRTVHVTQRSSYASASKSQGHYTLPNQRQIELPESVYAVHAVRGGGPGGQGANSSSNKVELRVSMSALSSLFDEDVMAALRRNEHGRALTTDGATLIVTSHDFRSAHQNRESCLNKVRQMIHHASWVPPEEGEATKMPSGLITQRKVERRKRSNMNRARQAVRKGVW